MSDCRPENFTAYRQKISKTRGLHFIGWAVTLTRMLFGFAYDSELIEKPIRFGQQFNKPTKKEYAAGPRQETGKARAEDVSGGRNPPTG